MVGKLINFCFKSYLIKVTCILGVSAFLSLAPESANADIAGREAGSFQFLKQSASPPKEGVRIQSDYPGFDYDVGWQVENVDGQAVTQAQIMWWFPNDTRFPLPQPPGGSAAISQIPENIWSYISLYDLKFRAIIHRRSWPDKRYSLIFDLGIPNKPGEKKWSLNVPKTQSWDRLLTHYQGPGRNNGIYLSAEEAKNIIGVGSPADQNDDDMIVVENSWLLDARMSTVEFNHKLLATRLDWHADVMVDAIRGQLDNLKKIAGLPTDKLELRLASLVPSITQDMAAIPVDLQHLFDKLNSGVPEKYIVPVRRAYYHKERLRILENAKREALLLSLGRYVDEYPAWFDTKVKTLGLE